MERVTELRLQAMEEMRWLAEHPGSPDYWLHKIMLEGINKEIEDAEKNKTL